MDKHSAVDQWLAKEDGAFPYYHNRVNAGLYVINLIAIENSGIDTYMVGTVDENRKLVKVDLDYRILKHWLVQVSCFATIAHTCKGYENARTFLFSL